MAEIEIKIKGYKCNKCKHEWASRGDVRPRMCPKCKSVRWDDLKEKK